jgi:hypothetical protein
MGEMNTSAAGLTREGGITSVLDIRGGLLVLVPDPSELKVMDFRLYSSRGQLLTMTYGDDIGLRDGSKSFYRIE